MWRRQVKEDPYKEILTLTNSGLTISVSKCFVNKVKIHMFFKLKQIILP